MATTDVNPVAPPSTMPYPPLHTDKKFVVLSDWLVTRLAPLIEVDSPK
jgi:hypothetical protein